jgi:hypothetical protein
VSEPGAVSLNEAHDAEGDELLLSELLLGIAGRMAGGKVLGVVITSDLGEVVVGAGPVTTVKFVGDPDERGRALALLARYLYDHRNEVPRVPGRAA